jgi:hypothetical protein
LDILGADYFEKKIPTRLAKKCKCLGMEGRILKTPLPPSPKLIFVLQLPKLIPKWLSNITNMFFFKEIQLKEALT